MKGKVLKGTAVICGAIIITALGIDATDTLTGSQGTLLSQVIQRDVSGCPSGMSRVENNDSVSCVDMYEVSAGDNCPAGNPNNVLESLQNIEASSCSAESKPGVQPWRFVSRDQAMQACARSGKRLPTSKEWYELSLGITGIDTMCNISSGAISNTGESEGCVSPHGAFDMIGNVWEWVSDDVVDGVYQNRILPESGYVAQADATGMAVVSTTTEQELFGKDYFWSERDGVYGIIRGGYYSSDKDAGLYTAHADTLPTAVGTAIGFRCVK